MDFKKYTHQYKSLCKKYWNADISDAEALDGTVRLFNFAKAVSKPIPKDKYEEYLKVEGIKS